MLQMIDPKGWLYVPQSDPEDARPVIGWMVASTSGADPIVLTEEGRTALAPMFKGKLEYDPNKWQQLVEG